MQVPIDAIESVLAHAGITTVYYGSNDFTSYIMENGGQTIELVNAVSGEFFRSDDLLEAILYTGPVGPDTVTDATPAFESVETLEEFIIAVNDTFGTVV